LLHAEFSAMDYTLNIGKDLEKWWIFEWEPCVEVCRLVDKLSAFE